MEEGVLEGRVELRSLEDWQHWKELHPQWKSMLEAIVNKVRQDGFTEPTGGRVHPQDITATDRLREGLLAAGLSSRHRAVLRALGQRGAHRQSRIYGAEATTPLALRLRGSFPWFLGSEYASADEVREKMFPVPHLDLMNLDLPTAVFDFVMTNDVLEHVPDMDIALRSLARILKPGGWHVGTVPFRYANRESLVKARFIEGNIQHFTEPEYHGNPFEKGGSLVFELPGWDLIDRAELAGFSDAYMEFVWSAAHGIVAEELGIFVLALRR